MARWKKPVLLASIVGTLAGSAILVKDYFGGAKYEGPRLGEGKVVIVTGSNTGIGKETARELAKTNAKVYMACRDINKCEEARKEIVLETRNKYVYCRVCDLSSQVSIRSFVERFKEEEKRLDILINNAGVMRCPYSKTREGIEMQLGVNHMGHFLLTNLLIDMLKKSAPSRVVNVSSLAHKWGVIKKDDLNSEINYDPGEAYNQSKLANVLFTKHLAKLIKDSGVTVNAVHPGLVDTDIIRHMSFSKSYLSGFLLRPIAWLFIRTPLQGAQTSLYVALDPSLGSTTGLYFSDCKEAEVSELAKDDTLASWLWQVSLKWTRLEQSAQLSSS